MGEAGRCGAGCHTYNPLAYYDLEGHLFGTVHDRFHSAGSLGAFDFFSIVIWKANRAKSRVAARLQKVGTPVTDLELLCTKLTSALYLAPDQRSRFMILVQNWRLQLPMASAVLTVLWPNEFTIFDSRVSGLLLRLNAARDFNSLAQASSAEKQWLGYREFIAAVEGAAPATLSLRDKDRWLFGSSQVDQLHREIQQWSGKGE